MEADRCWLCILRMRQGQEERQDRIKKTGAQRKKIFNICSSWGGMGPPIESSKNPLRSAEEL